MICSSCGDCLSGGIGTFGPHDCPLCFDCWARLDMCYRSAWIGPVWREEAMEMEARPGIYNHEWDEGQITMEVE